MSDTLKVNEIFFSICGEGYNTGKPTIFIRLSGCNLKCKWCDTPNHNKGKKMTVETIMKHIKKYPSKNVCITGGEPTIQNLHCLYHSM